MTAARSIGDDVEFEQRLGETIAWCSRAAVAGDGTTHLWSEELRPWPLSPDRAATVLDALKQRARREPARRATTVQESDLRGGALLLYFPDENLADGAAELETKGFFDADNVPPWDTWVGLFLDDSAAISRREYLVSWVPPSLVSSVERGIRVNPEGCILWLADSTVPLALELRGLGLVV
jgi:hypothetical protein